MTTALRKALSRLKRWVRPPRPPVEPTPILHDSIDEQPWEHPFLTRENIRAFRQYSLAVRACALDRWRRRPEPLDVGFAVNLAQNMYKWARMLGQGGAATTTLYLHEWDQRAVSRPEWEEFDGSWPDLLDGAGFLQAHSDLQAAVPTRTPSLNPLCEYSLAWRQWKLGKREPLLALQAACSGLRLDSLAAYDGLYGYLLPWARELARHDVSVSAYFPVPAYLSGKPYCVLATGDDVQHDCGLASPLGQLISLAFNGARFLWITNPHVLGHCRRLGFKNGLYVPYPMDDRRYSPGEPRARQEWEAQYGPGFYVLSTARLDQAVKGNSGLFDDLAILALRHPSLRFVFLSWGADAAKVRERIQRAGLQKQFLLLPPVGKLRLIDYYRSCDCVLDQMVYGYYGATGLEALSVGKPVVMRIRTEHYDPLYDGDVAPVLNCESSAAVPSAIESLLHNAEYRARVGAESRAWLLRHHGEDVSIPLMQALLRFTMENAPLPADARCPLWNDDTPEETAYHQRRLRPVAPTPRAA